MKQRKFRIYYIVLMMLLIPTFFEGCHTGSNGAKALSDSNTKLPDLENIKERGNLVVAADFNSTSYFIFRGQPMGFQYQMLQELADYLDLNLDVRPSNDLDQSFTDLNSGEIDLIAVNLTITADRKNKVAFTTPHSQTRQVLVQRKPDGYNKMYASQMEDSLVRNQLDLAGKTVYVQKGSVYYDRLKTLANEIGADIDIQAVAVEAEQLVHMVAQGEIDYTVADENVAVVNNRYYPILDVQTAVSFPQNLAWAVRKSSVDLKKEVDQWLIEFKKSARYAVIYNKYFNSQYAAYRKASDYYVLGNGKISQYDEIVKQESEKIGWDWRLVSSMIYQESRFNSTAQSWAGAYGLMQMMPVTAKKFGVNKNSSPEVQIRGGVSLIEWLDAKYRDEIKDPQERVNFVLAAYNVGRGHVNDAMKLAEKFGDDPHIWEDNVEKWLLNKSQPVYYKDEVVKYGYARGVETVNYVEQVIDRYEHYKNIVDAGLLANNQLIP